MANVQALSLEPLCTVKQPQHEAGVNFGLKTHKMSVYKPVLHTQGNYTWAMIPFTQYIAVLTLISKQKWEKKKLTTVSQPL